MSLERLAENTIRVATFDGRLQSVQKMTRNTRKHCTAAVELTRDHSTDELWKTPPNAPNFCCSVARHK